MLKIDMEILGYTPQDLGGMLKDRYGKGQYHGEMLFKHLHREGSLNGLEHNKKFSHNQTLAINLQKDFSFELPHIGKSQSAGGSIKFTLKLAQNQYIESVIIPMGRHYTLCLSSQLGCARGCRFCRTASMGLVRNLKPQEIVAQYWAARKLLGKDIQNLVFMGMGEPLDNLDPVLKAVDILSHPWGASLDKRRISLSTCGQGKGMLRLKDRIDQAPEARYDLLPLALSLHSTDDTIRSELMPVNEKWSLEELKDILLSLPHGKKKDKLYIEYMVIPGVNDSQRDAQALRAYLEGLMVKVNLLPHNNISTLDYSNTSDEQLQSFWEKLRKLGISCYSRKSKGSDIQGACGQLATGDKSL